MELDVFCPLARHIGIKGTTPTGPLSLAIAGVRARMPRHA
jgi:hypothetical protein